MNTKNNHTLAPGQVKSLKFCPRMNTNVDLHETFAQCIESHECFSDDPCPLHTQFRKTEQKDTKPA